MPENALFSRNWRVGSRLGSCKLISAQTMIGSTFREISIIISSVLWVLVVLCCLYWHSFYQIDRNTVLITVYAYGVNHSLPVLIALPTFLNNDNNNYTNKLLKFTYDAWLLFWLIKGKSKVFYGQEPPSGESTTTECGVNYPLLAVMYWSSPMGNSYIIKNLRSVLGVSLENYFSPVGHAWHLLPWFFHGQLTDFPLDNYNTLCVVVCGHRLFTVFHYWNMDHYRRAATGEFKGSMEVYPDETPWTVPEIRR